MNISMYIMNTIPDLIRKVGHNNLIKRSLLTIDHW